MDKVSVDGVITVEESKSLATELEITEGMAFDRGYSSPYFVTDPERQTCEFENPLFCILMPSNDLFIIFIKFLNSFGSRDE